MRRMVIVLGLLGMLAAGCFTGPRSRAGIPLLAPQPATSSGMAPSGCQTVYQYGSRHGWGSGTHCQ